jgi:hypothetical protein
VDEGSQAERSSTANAAATVGPVLISGHPLRGGIEETRWRTAMNCGAVNTSPSQCGRIAQASISTDQMADPAERGPPCHKRAVDKGHEHCAEWLARSYP